MEMRVQDGGKGRCAVDVGDDDSGADSIRRESTIGEMKVEYGRG